MSKLILAFGATAALLVGLPAANLIRNGFASTSAQLALAQAPADRQRTIEVYVGALCTDGRMVVGSSFAELQEQGCRDSWMQELTEEQVMGLVH